MKKALAGPAKHSRKKKPERRGIVAAVRRRIRAVPAAAQKRTRSLDQAANRRLQRTWPKIERRARPIWSKLAPPARKARARVARRAKAARTRGRRWAHWLGRRLRPVAIAFLRALGAIERRLRNAAALAQRATTRASAIVTPERAVCAVIVASAVCLIVSQFLDYRGVEVGQPGYAGLPAATPPTVGEKTAGEAHAYLLVPVALLAAALAIRAARTGRRRLGRVVAALGALSVAVVLLVDLPAGLDASAQASQFSGAAAVLEAAFYAELASAAGLILGGMLLVAAPKAAARYHARRCRTRTNSFARVASALRRRRRRRASSRARGARSASPRRSGAASAPVSRP